MQLNFKQYSQQGQPLIILHGLFGSLSNWGWHSKELAEKFAVYGLDLRNHGASPHSDQMSYQVMAADVAEFLEQQQLESASIIGHSMGGKVAMQLALTAPSLVKALVVVDIAPVAYPSSAGGHQAVFAGMEAIDLTSLQSRAEADQVLAEYEKEAGIRQFLLTNLVKRNGSYQWRLNLPVLKACYDDLRGMPQNSEPFVNSTLFIKGELSSYIIEANKAEILRQFPNADVKLIMGAGHWLHAEKPQVVKKVVLDFLAEK